MDNQIFQYNGNPVTFQKDSTNLMVNATEMARSFGRLPKDWLKNQSTTEFLNELTVMRNLLTTDLVQIRQGGNVQGTWMHEDVAIEFARWLNPVFAIWCNDRIKELLIYGVTATPDAIENMLNNPDVLIATLTALKQERQDKERYQEQNRLQQEELKKTAPQVEYYNEVLMSESTHNTNQIAKELGMSAVTLNRKLQTKSVQYCQRGQWLLYSRYQAKGYTKTKTHTYIDNNGLSKTAIQTVWTEKGREFIHSLLDNQHNNHLS